MARIIKNGEIVADPWCLLAAGAEALGTVTVIKPQLLLPLARWAQELESLENAGYTVGVWLAPDDAPEALIPRLAQIPVIAIQFPSFTDGRGCQPRHVGRRGSRSLHGHARPWITAQIIGRCR